ncbi:MAG: M36 family metallopeptidase [Pyrinomonadaceae bacterium]
MHKSSITGTRLSVLFSLIFLGAVTALIILPGFFQSEAVDKGEVKATTSAINIENEPIYDIREHKSDEIMDAMAKFRQSAGKDASAAANARENFARGEANLKSRLPNVKVEYNNDIRSPEVITPDVYKSKIEFLTSPSSEKRSEILRDFIKDNQSLAGVTSQQADELSVAADYTNPDGILSYAHLEQTIGGVPVFRGEVKAGFTKDGRIIRVINNLAPGMDYDSLSRDFGNPADAVRAAAGHLSIKEFSIHSADAASTDLKAVFGNGDWATTAEKMYFPVEPGVAVPSWRVLIWEPGDPHYVIVDARDGVMLWRKNIQDHQTQSATYQVYGNPNAYIDVADSPAPMSPGPVDPTTGTQGALISRTNRTLIGNEGPLSFNNNGWITDGANITDGNAVEAGIDRVAPNGVDGPAVGNPNRVFSSTWNPAPGNPAPGDDPLGVEAQRGAVIQMFYVMNRYHDELYKLGFTEAARNFQGDNFARGGVGNDRVSAEGQDSSGTNNANFATPADGGRGRMQMFVWTGPTPDYDGTADADIIIHEITHGTSNRLHGNGSGLGGQGGMMGEGWSDWYAHVMLAEPTDPINGIYTTGGYATHLAAAGFTGNYYYGIRRFPKAVIAFTGPNGKPHNPFTFKYMNTGCDALIGTTTSNPAPNSAFPRGPFGVTNSCSAVHNAGEIWSSALWEVRVLMVTRLGFQAGTTRVLQVVTDGMKLAPLNPTMIQERDAIIAAAAALPLAPEASADVTDVREGFRRRGMGFSASVQSSTAVTESFDFPNVRATDPFTVSDTTGDNDGFPEPGENVLLNVSVTNPSTGAAISNVQVNVNGGTNISYGTIADGATVANTIAYTVPPASVCGSMHQVTINVTSSVGAQAPVTKEFRLGAPVGGAGATFTSSTAVTIPDVGVAVPYNTDIAVAGLTGNKIMKLEVTGISHTFPGDLDFLLVGPGGTAKYIALSDSGGPGDVTNLTLTLSDGAAALPSTTQWAAGDFKPTNSGANDPFAAPAPAGPYTNAAPGGADTFASAFGTSGAALNGTWSLFLVDDATGDFGTMAGWKLTFESNDFVCSLTPASNASISGRVTDTGGRGVMNARVKLVNGGTTINAITNNFGYYTFPTTTIGVNYTATATHKRYTFASQQINPSGNVTNLNFTALP